MTHTYSAYGVVVRVPFHCPQLELADPAAEPDVHVTEGPVTDRLRLRAPAETRWAAASRDAVIAAGPTVGSFRLRQGSHVTFDRAPGAGDGHASAYISGIVLGTILRQRGWLVLHATTVVTPQGAVVITGRSGAGKSTLAAALSVAGYSILTDDISPLRLDDLGRACVLAGSRRVRLTPEAAERLGWDAAGLPFEPGLKAKVAMDMSRDPALQSVPVCAVVRLDVHQNADVQVRRVRGREAFGTLLSSLYSPLLPAEHSAHFPTLMTASRQAACYHVDRPAADWSVQSLVDLVTRASSGTPDFPVPVEEHLVSQS